MIFDENNKQKIAYGKKEIKDLSVPKSKKKEIMLHYEVNQSELNLLVKS
jgi:hypothetical protein